MSDGTAKQSSDNTKKPEPARRGAGFPTLPLPAAVAIVHKAGEHGTDHSLSAFAGYAGHTTANSGPFKGKLAALKDWGLISTTGDRVVLTERGIRFARSDRPLEEVEALRESFLGCKIFKNFYDNTAKTAQKADSFTRRAVLEFEVAAASKDAFVSSLVKSAAAAGLAELTDKGDTITFISPRQDSQGDTPSARNDEDEAEHVDPPAPDSRRKQSDNLAQTVIRQEWPTDGGEVVLIVNSSKPIPADAYSLIADAVESATELAGRLGYISEQDQYETSA